MDVCRQADELGKMNIWTLTKTLFRVGPRRDWKPTYLETEKASGLSNRRNGKTSKIVKSLSGEFDVESTRDRWWKDFIVRYAK